MAVRVLLASPLPPPYGGISHWTARLRGELSGRSDVDLLIVNTAPRLRRTLTASVLTRVLEGVPRMILDVVRMVVTTIGARPDVVHVNTSGSLALFRDLAMLQAAKVLKATRVVHLRYGRLASVAAAGGWESLLTRWVLRSADLVIALDRTTAEVAGRTGARVARLPNFVDVPEEMPAPENRERFFLFVGWVIETKGVLELLDAWHAADIPGWELRIAGPVGDQARVLDRLVDLPARVTLLGEVPNAEVRRLMMRCGCFVLPSRTEGFPNVVSEAMSCAAPIIGSDVGAIAEMLDDGGSGIVVAPRSAGELAEALTLVATDDALRQRLGKRAWVRCREEYATDVVVESLVQTWRSVSAGGTG